MVSIQALFTQGDACYRLINELMTMLNAQSQIGKLKLLSRQKDVSACRNSLSSLLSNSSFKPSSMPPSEIFIVKKINDPLPGKLCEGVNKFIPDSQWQAALNNKLNNIYFNAVRPINGILTEAAEAVVFTDTGEFLACYTRDLVNDRAGCYWWWKNLLKNQLTSNPLSKKIQEIFIEYVQYVPAMLEKLSLWHVMKPVITALNKEDAIILSKYLAEEYALQDVSRALEHAAVFEKNLSIDPDAAEDPEYYQLSDQPEKQPGTYTNSDVCFCLQTFFSEQLPGNLIPHTDIAVEHVLLMGLGLVLHHRPWHAKSHFFQNRLVNILMTSVAHRGGECDEGSRLNEKQRPAPYKQDDAMSTEPVSDDVDIVNEDIDKLPGGGSGNVQGVMKSTGFTVMTEYDNKHRRQKQHLSSLNESQNKNQNKNQNKSTDMDVIHRFQKYKKSDLNSNVSNQKAADLNNDIDINSDKASQEIAFTGDVITTGLGGILYLLNLTGWLELSTWLENKLNLSTKISPWGLLEIIAEKLLGKNKVDYKKDAIWDLLRVLDGRECKRIDVGTMKEYRLPEKWFNAVYSKGESFCWFSDKARLCVWAASGYVIVDVARNKKSDYMQAKNILASYSYEHAQDKHKSMLVQGEKFIFVPEKKMATEILPGQWLDYLMSYISHRLRLACGSEADDLFLSILKCRGHIHVTSCHIDFIAPLENISLSARLAGLDRDPGWIAEVARVVLFHFDQRGVR